MASKTVIRPIAKWFSDLQNGFAINVQKRDLIVEISFYHYILRCEDISRCVIIRYPDILKISLRYQDIYF